VTDKQLAIYLKALLLELENANIEIRDRIRKNFRCVKGVPDDWKSSIEEFNSHVTCSAVRSLEKIINNVRESIRSLL